MIHESVKPLNSIVIKYAPSQMVYFALDGEPGMVRSVRIDAQGAMYNVTWSDRSIGEHYEHELTDEPFAGLDQRMDKGDGGEAGATA